MLCRLKLAILAFGLIPMLAGPGVAAQNPVSPPAVSSRDGQRALVKADPKRAKKLAEIGAQLEAAGNYGAALEAYEEAARYAPFDVTIVSKSVALRSRLVRGYIDDGERLAVQGDTDGAARNYALAIQIDPSNAVLMERLKEIESMHDDEKEPADQPAQGLPQVLPQKITKSFNLRTDLRSAYEQVAAAYGIKAAFDPDLPARNVHLKLEDVNFETAMTVLTLETGTFWRPLNSKLIFIAADTQEKRKAYDMEIEEVFTLPSSVDSTEITELVRALRELTGAQHIQQSLPTRTLTIRDTVPRVKLAGAIIHQVEQSRGEVLLEIQLLDVDRNNALKLGITPSTSIRLINPGPSLASQLRSAQSVTQLLTLLATIFGTPVAGGAVTTLSSVIPPLAAFGGGKTTFLLTLPSATADFAQTLSLVHNSSDVLLRAQDGKPATFFVGDRYPVTLSLLSASLGSNGSAASSISAGATGLGTTINEQTFTVGQGPVAAVAADFRNADTLDLAVVNQIDNSVSILLNQGVGAVAQFAPAVSSPIALGNPRTSPPAVLAAIASGNINTRNNSFPGLLVTDPVNNSVAVLLGNGDGTFGVLRNTIPVGNTPSGIVTGTFNIKNGDSNVGFVVTNFTDNTYSVFNGNGDGTFTQVAGSPFLLPNGATGPIALTVTDFNSDGYPDLAIVDQSSKELTILAGNGDGTFTEFTKSPYSLGNLPVAIASGILSGSTGPGLAIVNQSDNSVTVLLGNGDGTFVAAPNSPLQTNTKPSGVAIGNFLQQSTSGIAVTNSDVGTVTIYVDLGTGLIQALEQAVNTNPIGIVAGSFTNSSFPDVVVTNDFSGSAGEVTLVVSPTSLIAGSNSTAQVPYPGSEYIDIGVKVKATPTLHPNKEVTLLLDFDIKSLTGTSINGIPIISSRTLTQMVRLKEDETSLLTGLLDQQETKSINGVYGLATLPGIGYLFGGRNNISQETELLVLITPRRVREPNRISRTIYAGAGDPSGRGAVGGNAAPVAQPEPAPEQPVSEPPANQPPPTPIPQPQPQPNEPNQPPPQPPEQPSPPPNPQPEPDTSPPPQFR
jgi:type II secretory pathway component GspD/PulD (secretin)